MKQAQVETIEITETPIAKITGKSGKSLAGKTFVIYRVNDYQTTANLQCQTAIDCTCKYRLHVGRKIGRACKHMKVLSAWLRGDAPLVQLVPVPAQQKKAPAKKHPEPTPFEEKVKNSSLGGNRPFSIPKKIAS